MLKTIEQDPLFDTKKAQKKLRTYVEGNPDAIAKKSAIIVDHFHDSVQYRINRTARAMVVTGSIERAITYYYAISDALAKRKSPYKAIAAFSGDKEYNGTVLNEAAINGFPGNLIESAFRCDPYRILVCADKFQTGYDEPLLQTMYVDKILTDIKAVQTLSRLNRAHPDKYDTFVLDFANKSDDIKDAFSRYYKTTLLSDETDPNKLNELISKMEACAVWTQDDIQSAVDLFLKNAPRPKLDALLDLCVARYKELDEDSQVVFKGSAKDFVRMYAFLGAILPVGMPVWEKLAVFLQLLIPKLPSPKGEDLATGILQAIDLESYRAEVQAALSLHPDDVDYEIDPINLAGQHAAEWEGEYDYLSRILDAFHKMWGNIPWQDEDNVKEQIKRLPEMVIKREAYQNAIRNADAGSAHIESSKALDAAMFTVMSDCMELYKQYKDNPSFGGWLDDSIFKATYKPNVSSLNPRTVQSPLRPA